MSKRQIFHVAADRQGIRLDRFIEAQLPEHVKTEAEVLSPFPLSRTYIQKLIREGAITVNGKPSKPGYKLRTGDRVSLTLPDPRPLQTIVPEPIPLDILYEDSVLIVVNKPTGMTVHPAGEAQSGTLVNALLNHCQNLPGIGGVQRPGIVHRLDKDTSGVIVAAKTDHAHQHLSAQFEARTTTRYYYAVVCGVPPNETGTVNARIIRSPRDRRKMTVKGTGGRHAVTHYHLLERYDRFSLLKLRLETGRIHQIRVHLSHIGHPVAGDHVYGGGYARAIRDAPSAAVKEALAALNRQALHAHILGFLHPETEEQLTFSALIPDDMWWFVEELRHAETEVRRVYRTYPNKQS